MVQRYSRVLCTFLIFTIFPLWLGLLESTVLAMPPVQRMVLPNGLVLLVSEDHSLPVVTLQLLINSGSRTDPSGEEGLAHLTAKGLLLGTSTHTATAINEDLDFIGALLNASCGRDYSTLNLQVLRKDLDKGLDLFMEVLTHASFPEQEIRKEAEKVVAAIQASDDHPEEVAEKTFRKTLFLTSPYSHPVEGTRESVPRLTREAVVRCYRAYYLPNNSILSVVGDISPDEIKASFISRLGQWPAGKISEEPFVPAFAKEQQTVTIDRTLTQATIILGHAGVSRSNPDFYALTVMNYILGGGGFASRLLEEIRNKRGLAYSVASFFDPGKYQGSFQIILQTKNPSARKAIALSLEQMEKIRKEPVSDKELEGAKNYLTGSFPLRIDTQEKLANFLAQMEYYDLGLDYPEKYPSLIRSVTKEDVLKAAKTYLHPDAYVLVVVANLKEAGLE